MDVTSLGKKIKYGALSITLQNLSSTHSQNSFALYTQRDAHARPDPCVRYCNVRLSAQSSIKRESHPALCEAHVQVLRLSSLLLAMQVPLELQHIDPASRPLLQHMV